MSLVDNLEVPAPIPQQPSGGCEWIGPEPEPPGAPEQKYLDREVLIVAEIAEILRMEERLVYTSIKRGEIPGVRRYGKRGIIRISRPVFFNWLHGRAA